METQLTTVNELHEDTGDFDIVTIPPESSPPPVVSEPHSTPVTSRLNPIIYQIRKDNIAAYLLKYKVLVVLLSMTSILVATDFGNYKSTAKIMLVLLSLALLARITREMLHDEHLVRVAVCELVGISLIAAAFIYLLSVLLENTIFSYLPSIFGSFAAGMYAHRLSTASGGNTSGPI